MKTYSFYHAQTGAFHHSTFSVAEDSGRLPGVLARNTPVGRVAIEGKYDHLSQRVDVATGNVVDYQPPQPSADHEWDSETKRWQLSAAVQAKQASRAAALSQIANLEQSALRPMRELLLNPQDADATARLAAIEQEIASLRIHVKN